MPHDPSKFLTIDTTGLRVAPADATGLDVPHDDPSAHAALRRCAGQGPMGESIAATMVGLYDVHRAQGATVVKALEEVLLAALPAGERARIGR